MAKAMNRWVLVALVCAAFGGAGIFTGLVGAKTHVAEAQKQRWRNYASAVQRGERSASPEAIQALTDLVITDAETQATLLELMTWLGVGTLSLSLLLARQLARQGLGSAAADIAPAPSGVPERAV
jgi:hypothetical protein